jgi:hypothetical protein
LNIPIKSPQTDKDNSQQPHKPEAYVAILKQHHYNINGTDPAELELLIDNNNRETDPTELKLLIDNNRGTDPTELDLLIDKNNVTDPAELELLIDKNNGTDPTEIELLIDSNNGTDPTELKLLSGKNIGTGPLELEPSAKILRNPPHENPNQQSKSINVSILGDTVEMMNREIDKKLKLCQFITDQESSGIKNSSSKVLKKIDNQAKLL